MSDLESCEHPEDRVEVRKFLPSFGGAPEFRRQCLECLAALDRRPLDPVDLPGGVLACDVVLCKFERKQRGRTGLGGRGNSKRREYEKYLRSPDWRGRNGVRLRVLERDGYRCVDCSEPATCVAHKRYPADIWKTTPADCKASCKRCNDTEREQRIAFGG